MQIYSLLGRVLPPRFSMPLRARFGHSREPELKFLYQFVQTGDTVIDVGAHKGLYTYPLAKLVGPTGHVIAYEPQREMSEYLRPALVARSMKCVELRTEALSDEPGTATLSVPVQEGVVIQGQATLRSLDGSATTYSVPVVLLDDESFPARVSFVKIDVEGFELSLLRGGKNFLAKDKPALLIEVEYRHAGDNVAELADLLLDELGYSAEEEGPDGKLVPVDRERWRSKSALNERPDGRYINNFFFTV